MTKNLLISVLFLAVTPCCFSMHTSVDWLSKHVQLIDYVQEGKVDAIDTMFQEGAMVNIHELFGSWQAKCYTPTCTLILHNPYYQIWADYPETLLHIASRYGYTKIVRLLIEQAAMEAIVKGNTDLLTTFLNQPDPRGFTAIHLAAKNNRITVAKILLRHKVHLLTKSITNHTPRELALTMGNTTMATLLLNAEQTADNKNTNS